MYGRISTEEYIFDASKSVVDGMFCGLPLDEDNESEKNDGRRESWAKAIIQEISK